MKKVTPRKKVSAAQAKKNLKALMQLASPFVSAFEPYGGKPYLPTGYDERKDLPIMTGVLDYFPLALLEVAKVSKLGNDQHNPGEPLHWARGKSMDQSNTALRHMMERGAKDTDGAYHSAKAIWRLLADLQIQLEAERGLMTARGCRNTTA